MTSIENLTSTFLDTLQEEIVTRYSFDTQPSVTVRITNSIDYITMSAVWENTEIEVVPPIKVPAPELTITVDELVNVLDMS